MTADPLALVLRYVRHLAEAESLAALPDGRLLERYVRGNDEAAFAVLVERYAALVFGVCRRLLGNGQDAEDGFQATFLVLARRAAKLNGRGSLGGWLHTVAYRLALRLRAQEHQRHERERKVARTAISCPQEPGAEELRSIVDEELQRLPDKYRLPLVLCYLQGKTNAEAAAELGWPAGSMSRRLTRARELLRKGLARRGVSLSAMLLGPAVAKEATSAARAPLLAATARAAVAFGRGHGAAGVSAGARVLAQAYLKGVSMTKIKVLAAAILLAAAVGGGALAQRASHAENKPAPATPAERAAAGPEAAKEQPSLLGSWRVVSLQIQGQQAPADLVKQLRVRFTKQEVTFTPYFDGGRDAAGKLNLRPDADGKTWPYQLGKDAAGTTLAYTWKHEAAGTGVATFHYRFLKDRLELCQDRPSELFSGKEGTMWVLERIPSQEGKPGQAMRLPSIKLFQVVDGKTVYMRTDNALLTHLGPDGGIIDDRLYIDGATGKTKRDPAARLPDEITLAIGEACMIEGKAEFHKFELVKIADREAVIHHTGHTRRKQAIDEQIRLTSYADADWRPDPKDPTRIVYTEWDDRHRTRIEKHYRANRLDDRWTQWYDNGRKEFEYHFVNGERDGLSTEWYRTGEKRYECRYRGGQKVGTEYWWRQDGTVTGIGNHPDKPREQRGHK